MGKVVIADVADAPPQPFQASPGISAQGAVLSRAIIAEGDRPLWLHQEELAPSAGITVDAPEVEHLFYVLEGEVESRESGNEDSGPASMPEGSVIAITRGASASLKAAATGAKLLHFRNSSGQRDAKAVTGKSHVHQIGPRGKYTGRHKRAGGMDTIWLDSGCPDCGLWIHRSDRLSEYKVAVHKHSEDEIIVVLRGEMTVGRRKLGKGSAIGVDSDTRYSFSVGEPGLCFLNFRPTEPWYVAFKEGLVPLPPKNERDLWQQSHIVQ